MDSTIWPLTPQMFTGMLSVWELGRSRFKVPNFDKLSWPQVSLCLPKHWCPMPRTCLRCQLGPFILCVLSSATQARNQEGPVATFLEPPLTSSCVVPHIDWSFLKLSQIFLILMKKEKLKISASLFPSSPATLACITYIIDLLWKSSKLGMGGACL